MDQATKAKFILALHKHSLQAFDSGGTVNPSPVMRPTLTQGGNIGDAYSNGFTNNAVTNGATWGLAGQAGNIAQTGLSSVGGVATDAAADFTAQNQFSSQAPTSAGVVGSQQAGLAGELENESAGGGPNPAQIQYLQNSQNIAQGAAQANAQNRALNPGLAARMSGNQSVQSGQTAAGTSAAQQAEQQIVAQQQLQGLTGQEQSGSLGADQINAGIAQNNANSTNQTLGGVLGGAGSLLSLLAKGGDVEHIHEAAKIYHPHLFADGGDAIVDVPAPTYASPNYGVQSNSDNGKSTSSGASSAGNGIGSMLARGGPVEKALMKKGGAVKASSPAQKAKVKDNSFKNDKVPAMLSEKEIVLPRSITTHPNAPQKAAEFVQAVLNKRKMGRAS